MKVPIVAPEGMTPQELMKWGRDMAMTPRPLVIVTTVGEDGVPNAALKCNFMVISSLEKVAIGCYPEHDTYRNILATKEFVVNIPPVSLLRKAMVTAVDFPPGVNEMEEAGLTAIPSEKMKPPRIEECKLHLECELLWYKDEVIVGNVVAASMDEDLLNCDIEERQRLLDQVFLVSAEEFGTVGEISPLPLEVLRDHIRRRDDL
jgi:flavin reductase (DIM6/NTAB) family NADH-FMN oxidoreductase RutF